MSKILPRIHVYRILLAIAFGAFLSGCQTLQQVQLGTAGIDNQYKTAAIAVAAGNSERMHRVFEADLRARGYQEVRLLDPETRKFAGTDLVLEYKDEWVWDFVYYLHSLKVTVYDPKTGDIAATASWGHTSYVFHSYIPPEQAVKALLDDVFAKIQKK